MLTELEERLNAHDLHLCVEPLYWNGDNLGFVYRVYDTMECATLVLTNAIEYTIDQVDQPVIHIRDLYVIDSYRRRGIARLLLFYGLCHATEHSPDIRYSDLEDDTDFPVDEPGNLYYHFGYRFKEGDAQEKWLDLEEFKKSKSVLFSYCTLRS